MSVVVITMLCPVQSVLRNMVLPGVMETVFGLMGSVLSETPVLSVVASTMPPLALHVLRDMVLPGVMETVFGPMGIALQVF